MEHLANILQQLSKSGELQNVVNILQRSAQESPDSGSAAASGADIAEVSRVRSKEHQAPREIIVSSLSIPEYHACAFTTFV